MNSGYYRFLFGYFPVRECWMVRALKGKEMYRTKPGSNTTFDPGGVTAYCTWMYIAQRP